MDPSPPLPAWCSATILPLLVAGYQLDDSLLLYVLCYRAPGCAPWLELLPDSERLAEARAWVAKLCPRGCVTHGRLRGVSVSVRDFCHWRDL